MIHRRMDVLKRLLTLSRIHLQLVFGEKWEDWKAIAHEKEDLYKRLMAFKGMPIHPAEEEVVDAIRNVEKQISGELTRKRNEIEERNLTEIERFTGGIKTLPQFPSEEFKTAF